MLLMDRQNLHAPGWSHVVSLSNDLSELEAFRERVGAPIRAFHLKNPKRPHLDLRGEARERALACEDVMVFERTVDLVRYWKAWRDMAGAGAELQDGAAAPWERE